ncbi:endo-1,4-beta-mannanase 1 [Elysia marginata]|uniref:Endo-1,4-beta-mannanase 1 n=1 Tax=Elysia marginata TaxID=1093978 RepID=A0AAV4FAE8_9GAST|nr:endo-1,4-beta-mannanase 1 [Elysia marginata]
MSIYLTFLLNITLSVAVSGERLSVSGNHFLFKGEKVFLSGGNLPWINYGYDYGNNQWAEVKARVEKQMQMLHRAGGNSLRLWIHIQGESTPQFNEEGYVIATDTQGTFIADFKDMLDLAQSYDIFVIPTLWNAAVDQDYHNRLNGLIIDPGKLTSYIRVVLTPLVEAVIGHPALAAWEIMNEPEGLLNLQFNEDPCFDTFMLKVSGAGWAGWKYSYQQLLRFISWQTDAIKSVDPQALVTVGVWNPKSNTNSFGMVDHYSDTCLYKAGQKALGKLDFHDFHSYSFEGEFDTVAAFVHNSSDYRTSKPVVVGEFWSQQGGHRTTKQLFEYLYRHGYSGAWSWDLVDNGADQRAGISHIQNYTGNGKIHIDL